MNFVAIIRILALFISQWSIWSWGRQFKSVDISLGKTKIDANDWCWYPSNSGRSVNEPFDKKYPGNGEAEYCYWIQ